MIKFKRKKLQRYNTIDVGLPPLEVPPKTPYPNFSPDSGSFNHDKFHRTANTFSDKDFQLLGRYGEEDNYTLEAYKSAIFQGVDLFKNKAYKTSKWANRSVDDDVYARGIKKAFRDFKDPFAVRQFPPQEWDHFFTIYGPSKLFNLITQGFQYIYLLVTREQPHAAIFTYYYFYYYFYFTEYILENVYLYFPILRLFFSNQIFSTFEGAYFSFFEIILGFYLPVLLFFFMSQYQLIRSFFSHWVYFVSGAVVFFYTLTLPFVYHFTGYSNLFFFIIFYTFFIIFGVFYIFEYRPGIYFNEQDFRSYSSHFLPAPETKVVLCLPRYVYRYLHWPGNRPPFSKNEKKFFTRFPFTQNLTAAVLYQQRIKNFRIKELGAKNSIVTSSLAPRMTMSGLVFPKIANNYAYSISSHRSFLQLYPQKKFSPFEESGEHDFYDEPERDYYSMFVRDFINHPEGYSQVSFVEFISKNKSYRSFDPQFNFLHDEEKDFYNSVPSKKSLEYLYPYLSLRIWLNSLQVSVKSNSEDFLFENIGFGVTARSITSEKTPSNIPRLLVLVLEKFFFNLSLIFDKLTFYAFKKFVTPSNTIEFSESLKLVNKILIDTKRLSPRYYKNIFIFLVRGTYQINAAFSKLDMLSIRHIFTYTLILRQIEEIYFNVNQRIQYLDRSSLDYKIGNFFLIKFQKKLNGFAQIRLTKK